MKFCTNLILTKGGWKKEKEDNFPNELINLFLFHKARYSPLSKRAVITSNKNKLHNENKSSIKIYDDKRNILTELYFFNNKIYRENKPAIIYYDNDNIKIENYCINDKEHRVYGPSRIFYSKGGTLANEFFRLYNIDYTFNVIQWQQENNFSNWKEMSESDFNRMWFEML